MVAAEPTPGAVSPHRYERGLDNFDGHLNSSPLLVYSFRLPLGASRLSEAYLVELTSVTLVLDMSQNPISAKIDDRDSRVRFNGDWRIGGTPSDFKGTVSSSTRVGDSFVVPFYGQYIVVYGTIDASSGGVITNYSIDGGPPAQVISQRGATDVGKQQFWASPTSLNVTHHELTVTMVKINEAEPDEGTIWFDYFTVYDPSGHERMPSKKSIPKGAIAGIVVGAVLFVTCLILGTFFWIRRRRRMLMDEAPRLQPYYAERDKYTHEKRSDGESSLPPEARWRLSRNGMQPYAIELPAPSSTTRKAKGDLPQTPPTSGKRRTLAALEEAGSGPHRTQHLRSLSQSSRLPESVVSGSSSVTPLASQGHSSSGAPSLQTVGAFTTTSRYHRADRTDKLEETSTDPPVIDDLNHGESGSPISVNQTQTSSEVTSVSPMDTEGSTSRPALTAIVTHSTNPTNPTEEGVARSRSMIQHVDSGIRLGGEELDPPIELPPVYSPN